MSTRDNAARARRGAVPQRRDRPRQRAGYTPAALTLRPTDTPTGGIHFHGLATAYERGYEMYDMFGAYTEIVSAGAGARSLARPDLDVSLNIGHDQLRRLASTTTGTLQLRETIAGLEVDAPDLDPEDHDVAYILPKLRAGLITEMSFAFRIERGEWSPDYTEYRIHEYDIQRGDVAIVGYGANPHTAANLRSAPAFEPITKEETRFLHYL